MKRFLLTVSLIGLFSGTALSQVVGDPVLHGQALVIQGVTSGMTASVTQTQAGGTAITTAINQFSVVANTDDATTLPTAVAGLPIHIINDGANTLQIFPFSGDVIGELAVNVSIFLEAGESVELVAYDTTNWEIEASTQIAHVEVHDTGNSDVFVINDAGTDRHSYHTNGLVAGDLAGWTFDAGGAGTSIAISGIASGGAGLLSVSTGAAHGLAVGDIISQTNLSDGNYTDIFIVQAVPDTTTYTVLATFASDGTGTMDQAATWQCNAVAAGTYQVAWSASGTTATNNEVFDFGVHIGATHVTGSTQRNKFGTSGDVGAFSGIAIVDCATDDKMSFHLVNVDSAGNITIRNFTLIAIRL